MVRPPVDESTVKLGDYFRYVKRVVLRSGEPRRAGVLDWASVAGNALQAQVAWSNKQVYDPGTPLAGSVPSSTKEATPTPNVGAGPSPEFDS